MNLGSGQLEVLCCAHELQEIWCGERDLGGEKSASRMGVVMQESSTSR